MNWGVYVYGMLLVSSDEGLSTLAMKFVPYINRDFRVLLARNRNEVERILDTENGFVDIVVIDHDDDNPMHSILNAMGRGNHDLPVVIVLKEPTVDILGEALNEHVDQYVRRGSRIPNDFFNELCQKCVMSIEKNRSEKQRRINEKRMEALITIAKMSDRNFSEIVDYAMEKSLELTGSKIGYVSIYNRNARKLTMMSWSNSAMKQCGMSNYPLDFDLDTTGIWGEPIRSGKTVVVNDYKKENLVGKKGTPMGHVSLDKLLMIPITYNGQIVGTAGVGNKERDYTWFDELQFSMIMGEMFSIYFQLESARNYSYETSALKDLINRGPIGFMMVDKKMQARFMNEATSCILDWDSAITLPAPLDSSENENVRKILEMIKAYHLSGEDQRSTVLFEDGDQNTLYDVRVTAAMDGYAITFNDITEVHRKDEKINRALEHIRIIEGPVLENLRASNARIQSIAPCIVGDYRDAVRTMDETVNFMDYYRDVGIMDPAWMDLRETILMGSQNIDMGNVVLNINLQDIMIKADPAFPSVFYNLIDNSLFHGGHVGLIDVRYRITKGNLIIIYSDNGKGMDPKIMKTCMNMADRGKFGMFLIGKIVAASGFSIRALPDGPGATFEITVPPESYTIG